jgi:phosphatidylinositol alpha-1,6-mannosyltransferase
VVGGLWYPDGLVALLAGSRNLVLLAHGLEFLPSRRRWREPVWKRLRRWVCESAALVVANSHYTEGLVRAAAPGSRVVTIPLGVDHLLFHPGDAAAARERLGIQAELVIASVSRLYPYKGHDTVLRAMAKLPEPARARFLYLIAGQGPALASLRRCAGELGLLARVRFLGFVPEERLPDVYRASDVFVLCSRESAHRQEAEGFGLVFLEAQACGTPVVGTRTGGIADAVREGEGGWLIDPDDADSLARILMRMTTDTASFREAGESARRRVERDCTWAHYVGRLLEALRSHGIAVN